MAEGRACSAAGPGLGALFMLSGIALITISDACAKWLVDSYDVGQILVARGGFIILFLFLMCCQQRSFQRVAPRNLRYQLIRATLFSIASLFFILSLSLLPLAIVVSVMFASPIILSVFSPYLLNERVGRNIWIGTIAGVIGIWLVVDPFTHEWGFAVLVPLTGAFIAAGRDVFTRYIASRGETTLSTLFFSGIFTVALGLAISGYQWPRPSWPELMILFAMGACQCAAHYLMIDAYRRANASFLGVYKYFSIVWAVILGWFVWGEIPNLPAWIGIVLIIGSGIAIAAWSAQPQKSNPDTARLP